MIGYACMHDLYDPIYSQYIPTNQSIWGKYYYYGLTRIGHCVVTRLDLSYLGAHDTCEYRLRASK